MRGYPSNLNGELWLNGNKLVAGSTFTQAALDPDQAKLDQGF